MEDPNLYDLPLKLSQALGIPIFAAQIFASIIIMLLFLMWIYLPIMYLSKRREGPLFFIIMVCFMGLGFCTAIGWLPVWMMLILGLLIVGLYTIK